MGEVPERGRAAPRAGLSTCTRAPCGRAPPCDGHTCRHASSRPCAAGRARAIMRRASSSGASSALGAASIVSASTSKSTMSAGDCGARNARTHAQPELTPPAAVQLGFGAHLNGAAGPVTERGSKGHAAGAAPWLARRDRLITCQQAEQAHRHGMIRTTACATNMAVASSTMLSHE